MNKERTAVFCIKIDFDKNSAHPERIFHGMAGIIRAFKELDEVLIASIDSKIQPLLMLEDVETGSLKTWLKQSLIQIDDDALKTLDWKPLVGQYLVKAKYILLNFLDKKKKIEDSKEIKELQKELLIAAEDTGVLSFPAYSEISPMQLINSIDRINSSLEPFTDKDKVSFISDQGIVDFNMDFNFSQNDIENMLTNEVLENETIMILKVKKPDYLGNSKWEFKYDNKIIFAKILDEEWIWKFQNRKEDIRPGDSLKSKVKITVKYEADGTVLSIQHDLLKIEKVIRIEPDGNDLFQN